MLVPMVTTILIFMGASAFYTADLIQLMDKSARLARIKVHLANVETAARIILQSPSSYVCSSTGGVPNCRLSGLNDLGGTEYKGSSAEGTAMDNLAKLVEPLDAVFCSPSQKTGGPQTSTCGFTITKTPRISQMPGEPSPVVTMELQYHGEFAFAPITIVVKPSPEALQISSAQCSGIFEGFNADGTIRCRKDDFSRAPAGQFISALNLDTYAPTFSKLPDRVDDCTGTDQFLAGYEWRGGEKYAASCGTRVSPFVTR